MIKFVVPGDVRGKGRPRFSAKTGTVYTPSDTREYEQLIAACYKAQGGRLYEGAVKIEITACYRIPKSTSSKKRLAMLFEDILPTKKPDIDNIAKVVLDALNGVAYKDDKQVTGLTVEKIYYDTPGLEIWVRA